MPPLPSPGKVIELQLSGTNEGGEFMNRFHMAYTGTPPDSAQLEEIDLSIEGGYEYIYTHNGLPSIPSLTAKYIDLSSDTGAEYIVTHDITGTLEGSVVSMNNAVVVSWTILRRYRGGHPRSYFALGSSDTLAGSSTIDWQASFITNIQNDCISFMDDINGYNVSPVGQLSMVNVSYFNAGAVRVVPVVDVIQTAVAKTRVCSQRRRLGKVGG